MKIERNDKTYYTFDIDNHADYRMTAHFYGEEYVYNCHIGSNGNWTKTDNHGNRYVPFSVEDEPHRSDFEAFGEHPYVIVRDNGTVGYLVGVEKL
jgi:hypothetical protein